MAAIIVVNENLLLHLICRNLSQQNNFGVKSCIIGPIEITFPDIFFILQNGYQGCHGKLMVAIKLPIR